MQGIWKWSDGTPLDYTNWAKHNSQWVPNEPNGGTKENCMEIGKLIDGSCGSPAAHPFWNDHACDKLQQGYICKTVKK
jgi:hypothetical protein